MVVGFIGAGNMAQAMARGWARGVSGSPSKMLFTDSGSGRAAAIAAETGGEAVAGNQEVVDSCDVAVLAFSPGQLGEIAADLDPPGVVASLLGATPLEALRSAFPESRVVRLMPNLAVEVGRGVICVAEGELESGETRNDLLRALTALGEVVELDDGLMDAATAVMGCSPAYFAAVAEALADEGSSEGLDPETAVRLVAGSMAGTAALLSHRTPFEISTAVAHPGGSTEAGLEALEDGGGTEAFRAASRASLERMRQK